ncbi:MAG: hypothetical protein M1831_006275 [Alyxoria varia]|nr:MAG: hypothetical protein M1831_006275 [Alyxoria varia]
MDAYHHQKPIQLSTSSSIAPRSYIRWALCFPYDYTNGTREATKLHIQEAISETVRHWPHLRGFLAPCENGPDKGRLQLQIPDDVSESHPIKLEEGHHAQLEFNNYDTLAEHGFPEKWLPNLELGPLPTRPGSNVAPVFGGKLTFVTGGIILSLYYHHGISDGVCTDKLVDALAAATRGDKMPHSSPVTHRQEELEPSPEEINQSEDPREAVRDCKEYCVRADSIDQGPGEHLRTINPEPQGGFLPYKPAVGYTFCFGAETIGNLRKEINIKFKLANSARYWEISTNDVLAAIVWVHATSARSQNPSYTPPVSKSQIYMPVDHRKRVIPNVVENYVGYGVSTATASMDISKLVEAARSPTTSDYIDAITEVAKEIHRAVKEIDDLFVKRRLRLVRSLYDVRELTLNRNPDHNIDLAFNTWARLGVDYEWSIPWVPAAAADDASADSTTAVRAPDAVRRTWSGYVNGSCLVQPRRGSSNHNNNGNTPAVPTPQGSTSTTPPAPPHGSPGLSAATNKLSLSDVRCIGDLKRYARRQSGAPAAANDPVSSPESPGSPQEASSDGAASAGAEAPWEVMVQLWPEDMARLRDDARFSRLVDRTVG